jgi:POT family proton-dependent oligopeptide transporter
MPEEASFLGHPRGLVFLAFSEAWERFSFYGMQALLALYMVGQLLLPGHIEHVAGFSALRLGLERVLGPLSTQELASAIFGLYAGAVYLTPILGGLLADRVLGRRRTVILGALLMAAGHFLMAFEQPFLIALLCLVLGNGCFKGNIASQVGGLYAPGDQRRADAFQIFYVAISAGAFFAPLVCGTLGEGVGWHYGFAAAGIGMLVGLATYLAGQKYLPPEVSRTPASRGLGVRLTGIERARLLLLIALLPVFAVGAVGNQEIFNGYMLWAKASADFSLFGRPFPITWLITLDTIVGVAMTLASVAFWRLWARWRPEPDELTKITLGSVFFIAGLLMLAVGAESVAGSGRKVAMGWLVAFHVLNDIGFANVFPVALALYSRAAAPALGSTMIGIYYLQLFIGNLLVGWLAGLLDRMPAASFWLLHAGLVAASAAVFLAVKLGLGGLLTPEAGAPDAAPA